MAFYQIKKLFKAAFGYVFDMKDKVKAQTLDTFINNEQGSIKWSLIYAVGLCVIGVVTSAFIYLKVTSGVTPDTKEGVQTLNDSFKLFVSALPAAVTTLGSLFPFKEYFAKKNKITSCKFLRTAYDSPPVGEEIDKRFWLIIDKNLG